MTHYAAATLVLLVATAVSLQRGATAQSAQPNLVVREGSVYVELPSDKALFVQGLDSQGNPTGSPSRVVTESDVSAMLHPLLSTMENMTNTIAMLTQRLQAAEDQLVEVQQETQTALETKMDLDATLSVAAIQDSVKTIVNDMVSDDQTALGQTLEELVSRPTYQESKVVDTIASLVRSPASDNNPLGESLANIDDRLTDIEDEVFDGCGSHCRAGQYVAQVCSETVPKTVCKDCDEGTFSTGLLARTCEQCAVCNANEQYTKRNCTSSSDAVCDTCDQCQLGSSFQVTPCTIYTNRQCEKCQTCGDGFYVEEPCTLTANTKCKRCTRCDSSTEVEAVPCSDTADAVCVPRYAGMRAVLKGNLVFTGTGYKALSQFTSDSSVFSDIFHRGDVFNDQTGVFTCPVDGYYHVAANIRVDDMHGQYFRAVVVINNRLSPNEGLHAIRGNPPSNYLTFSTSATIKLSRGDTLRVFVYSQDDTSFMVENESGFSVMRVEVTEGGSFELSDSVRMSSTGWHTVPSWRTNHVVGFIEPASSTAFDGKSGVYTATEDGIFIVSATLRIDGAGGNYFRMNIDVNGRRDINTGLHVIQGNPVSNYYSMHASGAMQLRKGDRVTVDVYSNTDSSFHVQSESSWSIVRVESTVGFSADKTNDQLMSSTGYNSINSFSTSRANTPMFSLGNAFEASSGKFTAPVTGYYFLATNVRIDGNGSPYFRVIIVANAAQVQGSIYDNGLHAIVGDPASNYFSMSPSGIAYLRKGDVTQIYVYSDSDSSYYVQHETGFSAILLHTA